MNKTKATLCVTHEACGQDLPAEILPSSSDGFGGFVEAVATVPVARGRANDLVGEFLVNDGDWGGGGQSSVQAKRMCSVRNVQEDDDKVAALVNEWETWLQRGGSSVGFAFQPSTSSSSGGVRPTEHGGDSAALSVALGFSEDKFGPSVSPTKQCPTQ